MRFYPDIVHRGIQLNLRRMSIPRQLPSNINSDFGLDTHFYRNTSINFYRNGRHFYRDAWSFPTRLELSNTQTARTLGVYVDAWSLRRTLVVSDQHQHNSEESEPDSEPEPETEESEPEQEDCLD